MTSTSYEFQINYEDKAHKEVNDKNSMVNQLQIKED